MNKQTGTLTVWRGTGLMLNIVIGAGLLSLPGLVFNQVGTQAIWAWVACAVASLPIFFVFTKMGREYPNSGGVGHFARVAFGPRCYGIASYLFIGAVMLGLPAIALTGGHYLSIVLPGPPVIHAILLLLAGAASQLLSPALAGKFSAFVSSGIVLALTVIVIAGLLAVDWRGATANFSSTDSVSLQVIFSPFMMIFFAFTGWEVAASLSEDFATPERDFPKAMVFSYLVATIFYLLLAFVTQFSAMDGGQEVALAGVLSHEYGHAAGIMMAVVASVIVYANLMGATWAVSRLVQATAWEGWLPTRFASSTNGVPLFAVAATLIALLSVVALYASEVLSLELMLQLAGQNFLILYCFAAFALTKLTNSGTTRFISIVAGAISVALLLVQGLALAYPLALAGAALLVWAFTENDSTRFTEARISDSGLK